MAESPSNIIWYELLTSDLAGAAAFYRAVTGLKIADADDGAVGDVKIDYRMIVRDDDGLAGGAMALTAEMTAEGARPGWLFYLHVPDTDAAVAAIAADGGAVRMPATTMAGVGRMALVADPQGVPFYVMTPQAPPEHADAPSDVFDPTKPQHVRWNELASPDQTGAMAFYAKHFGFAFDDKMEMGEFGDYCFMSRDGITVGAIMQRQSEQQPARWLFYFGVPAIAAAKRAVEAAGGAVLMGPHQVPGGDWILVCADPQGAGFGLVGELGE